MKKLIIFLMVGIIVLSMAACGSKGSSLTGDAEKTKAESSKSESSEVERNPVESVFFPATSSETGAYATIKVSKDVKMDDESAWLGLCPAGKDYITEIEADDVDVIWFNADAREENDPYIFACDFSSVEDGKYALVVATSDDENVGYIVIQLEMSKKGDKLDFDFENAKLKERPAK